MTKKQLTDVVMEYIYTNILKGPTPSRCMLQLRHARYMALAMLAVTTKELGDIRAAFQDRYEYKWRSKEHKYLYKLKYNTKTKNWFYQEAPTKRYRILAENNDVAVSILYGYCPELYLNNGRYDPKNLCKVLTLCQNLLYKIPKYKPLKNAEIKFVSHFGHKSALLFSVNGLICLDTKEYVTYDVAKRYITRKYSNKVLRRKLLLGLRQLRLGGQDIESLDWEAYSVTILDTCPELIHKYPEKFDWEKWSWRVLRDRPHLVTNHVRYFNWQQCSDRVPLYRPDLIAKHPYKVCWESAIHNIKTYCPHMLEYAPVEYRAEIQKSVSDGNNQQ